MNWKDGERNGLDLLQITILTVAFSTEEGPDEPQSSIPVEILKADSHVACRAHAVPLPCRAAKGFECVFPI